jgi:hypothetical protein
LARHEGTKASIWRDRVILCKENWMGLVEPSENVSPSSEEEVARDAVPVILVQRADACDQTLNQLAWQPLWFPRDSSVVIPSCK